MANRDLLREAIADAKAVKEVAIANAKAALEEAFTPQLQSMLSEKIASLDEADLEEDLAEVDKLKKEEKELEEAEGKETNEAEEIKEEELEEDLDLEEILAELELEEETNEPHGNIGYKQEEGAPLAFEEGEDPMEEGELEEAEMEEGYDKNMEEAEGDDMEIDLENMSEDELQGFIEDIIEKMIEDGELVPGPNADESEEDEMEDTDDGMEGDADVDIEVDDIDLQEGDAEMEEGIKDTFKNLAGQAANVISRGTSPDDDAMVDIFKNAYAQTKSLGSKGFDKFKDLAKNMANKANVPFNSSAADNYKRIFNKLAEADIQTELKEAKTVIKHLKSELNEVNLLNSKLLYTNKIFRAKNLTENQKIKVLKAFDKAETVNEAKVIFESLNENLVNKSTKSNIKESMGFASKPAGVAPKHIITEEKVIEEDAMVSRFKKLAGIK